MPLKKIVLHCIIIQLNKIDIKCVHCILDISSTHRLVLHELELRLGRQPHRDPGVLAVREPADPLLAAVTEIL